MADPFFSDPFMNECHAAFGERIACIRREVALGDKVVITTIELDNHKPLIGQALKFPVELDPYPSGEAL